MASFTVSLTLNEHYDCPTSDVCKQHLKLSPKLSLFTSHLPVSHPNIQTELLWPTSIILKVLFTPKKDLREISCHVISYHVSNLNTDFCLKKWKITMHDGILCWLRTFRNKCLVLCMVILLFSTTICLETPHHATVTEEQKYQPLTFVGD